MMDGPGRRRRVGAATLVVALLSAATLQANLPADRPAGGTRVESGHSIDVLRARGHARGLYPGAEKRLRVTVRNRGRDALRLLSLRTRVGAATAGCPARMLTVASGRSGTLLPGRTSTRIRLRARMDADAADSCQGQRFPLAFRVRARRLR